MFCAYTWPRYQVSVTRTIGPLVSFCDSFVFSEYVLCQMTKLCQRGETAMLGCPRFLQVSR